MGYKVDFDALDSFNNGINTQVATWESEMNAVSDAVTTLQESTNMSGSGADNIRSYFENVHGILVSLFYQLLASQQTNCFLYKRDYFSNVDTALHAIIKEDELNNIKNQINSNKSRAINVDGAIADALSRIKDIFYVSYNDVSYVDAAHRSVTDFICDLDEEIKNLESTHYQNDFDETEKLISALRSFILEQKNQNRSYKSNFNMEKLAGSESFRNLYNAYVDVAKDLEKKAPLLEKEIENENQRIADLEAERAEREKKATIFKWVVTGVCIIGAVVITAATGGAGAPLIVGAISAGSSMIMATANNLADQYIEHGYDHSKYDWGSLGKDVAVAGITGFATGAIGAGVGGAITKGLGSTTIGNTLLHSSNSLTRIGTAAVIGSVSEGLSGIASRSAGAFINVAFGEEELGEALHDIVDPKNIVMDVAIGGVGGAVDNYVTTKRAQKAADDFALSYNSKHDPVLDGEKNGIKNLKRTKNNGADFSDTDQIFRLENGEAIEVKIKATGNREKDYRQAEKILKEQGIDIDFKSMRTGENKTHVWHHLDDYDVATNETTMQFIKKDAHTAVKTHTGSAKQYHIANGKGYSKNSFETKYDPNITYNASVVNEKISTNVKNIEQAPESTYERYKFSISSNKEFLDEAFSHIERYDNSADVDTIGVGGSDV